MDQHTITFIINPISGTGQKDAILAAIEEMRTIAPESISVRRTERAGHATEIAAEEAARGIDVVVAVGGDGTVNEVARALVHTETALGIIPCGSGNGLARHLRIPMDVEGAFQLIEELCITSIDYGTINDAPFFCTCGVGFDAFISQKFAEAGKRGLATYVEKTLTDGIHYRPQTYRVEIDGDTATTCDAFLIACANASQYGNNAYIAPEASTRDGLLDVTILTPFNPIEAPQIIMQMFNRTLSRNAHVRTFRTSHLRITRETEGPAHIDGDPITLGDVLDVSIHPLALRVVANGRPGHRPLAFPAIKAIENGIDTIHQDLQREIYRLFFKNFNDLSKNFNDLRQIFELGKGDKAGKP